MLNTVSFKNKLKIKVHYIHSPKMILGEKELEADDGGNTYLKCIYH